MYLTLLEDKKDFLSQERHENLECFLPPTDKAES